MNIKIINFILFQENTHHVSLVSGEFEDSDTEDTDSVSDYMTSSPASENLVLPALNYLKQCCVILQSMWKMPACPVFHGAKR
jgi:hypothetical protein